MPGNRYTNTRVKREFAPYVLGGRITVSSHEVTILVEIRIYLFPSLAL